MSIDEVGRDTVAREKAAEEAIVAAEKAERDSLKRDREHDRAENAPYVDAFTPESSAAEEAKSKATES